MRRHAHHDTRAVGQQHVVAYQHRHALAVEPVHAVGAGEDARLLLLGRQPLDLRLAAGLVDVGLDVRAALVRRQRVHQRVLGRQDDEGDAEDRVDPGRECRKRLLLQSVLGDVELYLDPLAAADPVRLHHVDPLRPLYLRLVEQLVRVTHDAEEPLVHVAVGDSRIAPLAQPVDHLLVGQDRVARRAPVDRRIVSVCETRPVELQEQPLVPPVVVRGAGDDLPVPVVHGAHRPELPTHVPDVVHRPRVRMDAASYGRVLGVQPEGVEPHRVEDVVSLHAHEPGAGVRSRHRVPVADVEVARGVRVHVKLVPLGAGIVVPDPVGPFLTPTRLPLGLDGLVVVAPLRLSFRRRHRYAPI